VSFIAKSFFLDSERAIHKTPGQVTNYRFKLFPRLCLAVILVACQWGVALEATAQTNFFLSVQISPSNAVPVNSSVVYTIGVTNLSAFDASAVFVTNTFPSSVQILSEYASQGSFTVVGSSVVFSIGLLPIDFSAVMTVTAQPTVAGFFTNTVVAFSPQIIGVVSVNAISQATNSSSTGTTGDLAVSLNAPSQTLYPGDWTTVAIGLTNLGPNTVTNIVLTNTLPVGAKFLALSPSSPTSIIGSNTITFPFASLTNGGFQNFNVRVQLPTNSGPQLFSVSVGAAGSQDTNAANNFASTNFTVLDYFPSSLVVVTNSPQSTNRQNGLIEQNILVSNIGTSNADSVRVIVTGLTNVAAAGYTNMLFNSSGTNNGNPFVVYANTLTAGQSVQLLLQFYVRTRSAFPLNNSQLQAFAVSLPNLTPPPAITQSTSINFTNIALMSSGNVLIQFKSTVGKVYTIVYADNTLFSNAMMAVPPIIAPANYVQWIDYGPPATISKPGSGSRYYRVFLNP
jgi:uncharacterized repeat protein (TIGR01451 family)